MSGSDHLMVQIKKRKEWRPVHLELRSCLCLDTGKEAVDVLLVPKLMVPGLSLLLMSICCLEHNKVLFRWHASAAG